ncbi:arginase family protein [bacterium SCSIO 12741]|nr:arginase family protein [bacterium SCSIO 12741]
MKRRYIFSPFYNYKRAFDKHYLEHQFAKQLVLIPEEVGLLFQNPLYSLMGIGESVLDLPEYAEVLKALLETGVLVSPDTHYEDLTRFMVRPYYTYLGVPFADADTVENGLVLWGVPFALGNDNPNNLDRNSAALRRYGHRYNLIRSDLRQADSILGRPLDFTKDQGIVDIGDSFFSRRLNPVHSVQRIQERAFQLASADNRIIAIGGDHSITYPLFKGVQQRHEDLVCVHLDAHNDLFLTAECAFEDLAPSHSSVIAKLLRQGFEVNSLGLRSFVNVESLDFDELPNYHPRFCQNDQEFLQQIDQLILQLRGKKVYLTLDIDVLDPSHFSSVTDPLPGGLSPQAVLQAFASINEEADVVAMDLVEANVSADAPIDMHQFLSFLIEIVNLYHLTNHESF